MNRALIASTTCVLLCVVALCDAKWCIENTITELDTLRVLSRTRLIPATWYSAAQIKTETYSVTERVPVTKTKRVCCDGYVLHDGDDDCSPICPDGCPEKAHCATPNTCECDEGFQLEGSACVKRACGPCVKGTCTDDGECECAAQHVLYEGVCRPLCDQKCTNGFCAAANVCECNDGYVKSDETQRCEPACEEACGGNAYCSAPGICNCRYGFFGNASDVCQPWCKSECKNGHCIGPNNCDCFQGFVKVDGLCIPDCHLGCKFGDCLDEGVCQCWPDFVYNNETRSCEEITQHEFPWMYDPTTTTTTTTRAPTTRAPTTLFNPTTTSTPHSTPPTTSTTTMTPTTASTTTSTTPTTTSTSFAPTTEATSTPSTNTTAPSPTPTTTPSRNSDTGCLGCWGGICIDGVCQCPDGLILNDENDCIMPCEKSCKNGVCSDAQTCVCQLGFALEKNGTECVPQCDNECVNGFCIAPNHCECIEGYIPQLSRASAHVCLPTCDGVDGEEGCLNGTCVAINKCQCLEGFTHKPGNRFECIPIARKSRDYFWFIYLLLGLLILLVMAILGLYALRRIHQGTYNVDKVEKRRGTVQYKNGEQPYCYI